MCCGSLFAWFNSYFAVRLKRLSVLAIGRNGTQAEKQMQIRMRICPCKRLCALEGGHWRWRSKAFTMCNETRRKPFCILTKKKKKLQINYVNTRKRLL